MRKILILSLMMLGLAACRWVDPDPGRTEGLPADLGITISIPAIDTKSPGIGTKAPGYAGGNVSASDAASWANWDRLVDGQAIYRLTLFLVSMPDNKLVGYRDFYKNSTDYYALSDSYGPNGFCATDGTMLPNTTEFATCAKAHFSYLSPLHGASEKLGSGRYRIYAVANYSSITATDSESASKTYSGLPDDGNGTTLFNLIHDASTGIIPQFEAAAGAGIADFDRDHFPTFFDYKVKSAVVSDVEQFVCEQRPQPLTFITDDFLVLSGTNEISAELVRTYSRIRIVLNNESETEKLTLNEFSFVTPFAQKEACIFDFDDDAIKYNVSLEGKPVLNSTHCIHPYPGNGNLTIDPNATPTPEYSKVVFDAYVLESKRGANKYQYKVEVEYTGVSSSAITISSGTPIKTLAGLKSAYNAGTYKFLIKSASNDRGLLYDNTLNTGAAAGNQRVMIENSLETDGSNKKILDLNIQGGTRSNALIVNSSGVLSRVGGGDFADLHLESDYSAYVWNFEKTGDWNFNIMNELTGQYWDKLLTASSSERLKTVAVEYYHYELGEKSGTAGLRFRNAYPTGSTIYLHRDCYGTTSASDANTFFYLYPLSSGNLARAIKTVNLQVLDHDTHQPYDLEEFRRNDFITTNIFTSIHPDGGFLEFIVIPWNEINGEITFE